MRRKLLTWKWSLGRHRNKTEKKSYPKLEIDFFFLLEGKIKRKKALIFDSSQSGCFCARFSNDEYSMNATLCGRRLSHKKGRCCPRSELDVSSCVSISIRRPDSLQASLSVAPAQQASQAGPKTPLRTDYGWLVKHSKKVIMSLERERKTQWRESWNESPRQLDHLLLKILQQQWYILRMLNVVLLRLKNTHFFSSSKSNSSFVSAALRTDRLNRWILYRIFAATGKKGARDGRSAGHRRTLKGFSLLFKEGLLPKLRPDERPTWLKWRRGSATAGCCSLTNS